MGIDPNAGRTGDRTPTAILRQAGVASWSALGIIALAVVLATALSAISGILIPLVVAVILGIVLEPITNALKRCGVPSTVAVAATLIAGIAVAAGTVVTVVWGFVQQWPEIHGQVISGWDSLVAWAASLDMKPSYLERARATFEGHVTQVAQGVLGAVTDTFYGAISLFLGTFFALFFLFFALRDAERFPAWLARTTTLDADEIGAVIAVSRSSVRGYFRGTAVAAVITAPIFMIPLLLLGIPMAIPIFIVYFFLSFVPFVGAWIAGIFTVLIAFGSGGPTAALILAITFIISNGSIQSAVSSWALGSSLQLHPVAVLLATMVGGTVAGVLGMVLGAPLLAAAVKSTTEIRRLRSAG